MALNADMRIFVGYGYNERDRWVEDYVFPLVVAFGCEVLHGKSVYGAALTDEVMKALRTSDAVIGFTTRRETVAQGVAFILDTKLQAARTALRSGRKVNSTAGPLPSARVPPTPRCRSATDGIQNTPGSAHSHTLKYCACALQSSASQRAGSAIALTLPL
jgi:hypothetical protein